MKFDVYDITKKKLYDITLSLSWSQASSKCLHECVVGRLSNRRQGTACAKTRAEVQGTGAKPFKQKGLGRARRGSNYSPLIRGGGVSFAPKSRDFKHAVTKKKKANAYLFMLAELYRNGDLLILDHFPGLDLCTKSFKSFLHTSFSEVKGRIVVIGLDYDFNMLKSSANLRRVGYYGVDFLDILPIFYADKVVITEEAIKKIDCKYSSMIKVERSSRW